MRIVILGSAAGGGFPQWNCNCANCRRARAGDPAARPRTQCSLAVSGDGESWYLLNASPDLRQQILATPVLHPRVGSPRQSPLLTKPLAGEDGHGGGDLIVNGSTEYTTFLGWFQ